jgi:beta-glucosidase
MTSIKKVPILVVALAIYAGVFGQSGDFVTSGMVVDANNQPIAGATATYVSVAKRLSFDFSRADGTFGTFTVPVSTMRGNNLAPKVSFSSSGPVTIEIYDVHGKKISTISNVNIDKGTYTLESAGRRLGSSMYVVKIMAGDKVCCQKMINGGSFLHRGQPISQFSRSNSPVVLSKAAAFIIDTVRVGKTGFTPKYFPISTYSTSVGTVQLAPIDIEGQVTTLFGKMTDAEKIGQVQMPEYVITAPTAANVASRRQGSIFGSSGAFRAKTPATLADYIDGMQAAMLGTPLRIPLLFFYDGVHGMDVMPGGSILPHNQGMGAIQDSTIFEKAFRVAAIEMRATGANWSFGPCIAVVRDDRWGRSYEGFAETPELTSKLVRWAIYGLQTTDLSHPYVIAACTKNFAGDGGTTNGVYQGTTTGPEDVAAPIHLPGYASAVNAGTATIMPSLSSWCDGITMHGNTHLLTGWLKQGTAVGGVPGCNFDGFVVGDYEGHYQVTAPTGQTSTQVSMAAGLDVPMHASSAGEPNIPSNARTDDACKRVLRVKMRMNLMNQYVVDRRMTYLVGCAEHRAAVRAAVRASLVLLKNEGNALPIPKNAAVHVCGAGSNDIGLQCGGYTVTWQGSPGNTTPGTTILQGVQRIAGASGGTVTSSVNGATIGAAGYVIAVLSEKPYAEMSFNHISLTTDPAMPDNATTITNVKAAHAAGKKVIVVLMAGRILDISPIINDCDAFVWASLPGTEGDGIPEVLYRDQPSYDFTGKLPFTWPTDLSQEPINQGDGKVGLFPYGYGLSYGAVVTDIDGNTYHTVTIGTQVWMVENLKTTKFNDGTAIPLVTDGAAWSNLTTPGYCWYNDSASYGNTYGALYNWYTVNTGKLAPTGWHVPAESEWAALDTYLGGYNVDGGALKESGTAHWLSPNAGATNSSGFSALPAGCLNGAFMDIGSKAYWWTSTVCASVDCAYDRGLDYSNVQMIHNSGNAKTMGFSVRCVKD